MPRRFWPPRLWIGQNDTPADRRVPEALYIVFEANGWTKYGCGNNTELHDEIAAYLRKHYPNSEWTAKIAEEEKRR